MQRYGFHRGRQQYKCAKCAYQFINSTRPARWVKAAYQCYCNGKQTLTELSRQYKTSVRTLQRYFDEVHVEQKVEETNLKFINLILDAIFFSRSDGVLVFRADKQNLHWRFIASETVAEISTGIDELAKQGYRFESVTLDGRRGVIKLFEQRYPGLPIQLCQFHQAQIIRRPIVLRR